MVCLCFSHDEERQAVACILFHYQCGLCPCKCFDYDNDGMCWGCVCCQVQVDPCWLPRQVLHLICFCVPCGCIAKETIFTVCCCNPGNETVDKREADKAADKRNHTNHA